MRPNTPGRIGNLPAGRGSFVGRRREMAALARLLAGERLVTLTGPAGSGKSRLAVELAHKVRHTFRDGVWWVDLTVIKRNDLVVHAVLRALDSRPGRTSPEALAGTVGDLEVLLLLDNCEHVLDGCLAVVDLLLRQCPAAKVLATSREALRMPGEHAFPLTELGLPSAAETSVKGRVARSEAVRLFIDRAKQVDPGFKLTDQNAADVASICRRLEGIPLAIELAAQQVRLLGPGGILLRLADRLDLMSTGGRIATSRHASMWSAIDWSYQILAPDAQAVWRHLSVLVGPFTLDLAAAACAQGDEPRFLGLLRALEAKSLLITVSRPDGTIWLRQLESIRIYGRERLAAPGELDLVYDRLSAYLAGVIEPHLNTYLLPPSACQEIIGHENHILAAVEWLAERHDARLAVLACGLTRSWMALGLNLAEINELLGVAYEQVGNRPDRKAALLAAMCQAAQLRGDYAEQLRLGLEALTIERTLDRPARVAGILDLLATGWRLLGNKAMARLCYVEAINMARTLDDPSTVATLFNEVAKAALEWGEEGLAQTILDEGLPIAAAHGTPRRLAAMLHTAGTLALVQGNRELAEHRFMEGLEAVSPTDEHLMPYLLDGIGIVHVERGFHEHGLGLIACAEAIRKKGSAVAEPYWRGLVEAVTQTAVSELGERRAQAATAAGARVGLPEAVSYALSSPEQQPQAEGADSLSGQQWMIVALVTEGLTNQQIAHRLHVSSRTVATHLERIRDKLGIRSRPALAAWFARASR